MDSGTNPVSIELKENRITPGQNIHGTIKLAYNSRYDTVVINSQIEDPSGMFEFIELNGKRIDYPYPRLSIFEKDISDKKEITFVAKTNHNPQNISTKVKFRVSLVQEHKEIASDISYLVLHK